MDLCEQFYGISREYFDGKTCGHTAGEIAHQPKVWRDLCKSLHENKQAIKDFMSLVTSQGPVRIIMTGAGSSAFAGQAAADFVARSTGIRCHAIHTTDIVSSPELCLSAEPTTLLISFARSGNSPESDGAVRYARKIVKNLYEIALVCDGDSLLAKTTRESDKGLLLVMPEGSCDKGFAMTSSVSCMTLAAFALFNMDALDEITADINRLAGQVEKDSRRISEAALTCSGWGAERAWYLGSGAFAGLVQEGALKMMELTNGAVVAGYNSAAGFRHGPKTVLNDQCMTIHFISNDPFTAKYDLDLLKELNQEKAGNRVIAIHSEAAEGVQADLCIPYFVQGFGIASDVCASLQGLLFMQMLSMHTSLGFGITTDNPSPSGQVNRVVQGVTVYPYEGRK